MRPPIAAVAVGVAFGGLAQFACQLPAFRRQGFGLAPSFDFRNPALKRMALLLLPATLGMAVAQVNIFISNILASYLAQGSITYLYYAMRLVQFPIGIFGVAMGMAVLPALSEHAARGETDRLREDFSYALRLLFFTTVPAMAGLVALRGPVVNLLFVRGASTRRPRRERPTRCSATRSASGRWSACGSSPRPSTRCRTRARRSRSAPRRCS